MGSRAPEGPLQRALLGISGQTRIAGIFGDPVEHSRSPAMHNAAFAALGLDYAYVAFRVRKADLGAAVRAIGALGLAGVNVTVPHKEAVLPLCDTLTARARRAGAVNTIVNRDGRLLGDNTDVVGFLRPLQKERLRLRDRAVVVVGAGGAARGVLVALAEAGVARVRLANRHVARARRLARSVGGPGMEVEPLPLQAVAEASFLADAVLVVNTTSIGWRGERFPPLAYKATPSACLFYDLVYGRPTDFLERARRAGRRTLDGSEMLLHQGAAAFTLWTRRRAPLAAMRAAL